MEGDLDAFDFILAEKLGMTVAQMRSSIANDEYVQWRAFFKFRAAQEQLAADAAAAKAKRSR